MSKKKYYTVMLIDDNEIDNLINQRIIESAGICEHIYTHTGGRSAIEFLKNAEKIAKIVGNNDCLPEIIFLDIDMPLMDGFQFLDEFESLPKLIKEYCKIVMLTSSINAKDVKKSKRYANVKEYINKPLTKESLINLEV
ncbi:MAG: response regulator [Microscillaceae bacterium]|nr:response regulator [Microscillaceae bacterium]MDW8460404.1 response regulator [Cytophagales bacterium]